MSENTEGLSINAGDDGIMFPLTDDLAMIDSELRIRGIEWHHLKTWPEYFEAVRRGVKTFEVRKDDRSFSVDDYLVLEEYDPRTEDYSGRVLTRRVSYMLRGGKFGIERGYVVLGLQAT